MLLHSFTRRNINVGSRYLVRSEKTCLYSTIIRAKSREHQEKPTSSVRFTYSQLSSLHTPLESHPTAGTKSASRTMSDDAYSSFLDQANQDTGASKASSKSKTATTKAVDTDVPVTLQKVDQYYTSESDEPFEPVSLKWSGANMPSESMQSQRAPC